MSRISKYTRERMAKALVRHRFDERANELTAESADLFHAVLDERYDAATRMLMAQLERRHPGAFDKANTIYLRANGMRITVGANSIGDYHVARWSAEVPKRAVLRTEDAELSKDLADRIAAHALATEAFAEEIRTAYRRALGTLEQFTTAKKLAEEWPEAMPVIGNLIPTEDRSLPTVQLAAINDEFGLPPSDMQEAA